MPGRHVSETDDKERDVTLRRIVVACAVALGAPPLMGQQAVGRPLSCFDIYPVTHRGTGGDDVIRGTKKDDVIAARGGDDVVIGRGGDDLICGGKGVDEIRGGGGRDALSGGTGGDRFKGGRGDDLVWFYYATKDVKADLAKGRARGEGADRLDSIERLTGSQQDDVLLGDGRANSLTGGHYCCQADDDRISGRGGDDYLTGSDGADVLRGGDGNDTAYGDGSESGSSDEIYGGDGDDVLVGDNAEEAGRADVIDGGEGADEIWGDNTFEDLYDGGGPDLLTGGGGDDTINGQDDDDTLDGGDGEDTLDGGDGSDSCTGETLANCEDAAGRRGVALAGSIRRRGTS
jgi:Ca2+-binding RTX toxin-like protein